MSFDYTLACTKCRKNSGFFVSTQFWGFGNCDIIKSFKFLGAHIHCYDKRGDFSLRIIPEQTEAYDDWPQDKECLKDECFPHSDDWAFMRENYGMPISELNRRWIEKELEDREK